MIICAGLLLFGTGIAKGERKQAIPWDREPQWILGPFKAGSPQYYPPGFKVMQKQVIPEGCLGYGFEAYLELFNSGDRHAKCFIVVCGRYEYWQTNSLDLSGHQRRTLDLQSEFIKHFMDTYKEGADISIIIYSTSKSVFAEESMYWNHRAAGHTSIGFIEQ
jgi:hypothetical protein